MYDRPGTYTIYSLVNLDNMKRYIGRSKYVRKRIENHLVAIKNHKHHNAFINAESDCRFGYEILADDIPFENRIKERAFIFLHRSYDKNLGYNIKDPYITRRKEKGRWKQEKSQSKKQHR